MPNVRAQVARHSATEIGVEGLAGHVWTSNAVRVAARAVSAFSVDLPAVTLAVEVGKRLAS